VDKLLQKNPNVVVQMVLLDPFVPGVAHEMITPLTTQLMSSLASNASVNRIYRLENYYSVDLTDASLSGIFPGGSKATSQSFSWRPTDVNQRVDFTIGVKPYYNISLPTDQSGHGGPIRFYADTVAAIDGNLSDAFVKSPYTAANYGYSLAMPLGNQTAGPLSVSLVSSKNPVSDGGSLVYTATVLNTGAAPINDVGLEVLLPSGLNRYITSINFSQAPTTGSSWSAGENITWNIGTMNSGQPWTVQFTVDTSLNDVADGVNLRCVAFARSGVGRQATAVADTRVGDGLALQLRTQAREVKAGDTVRFVVTYTNRLAFAADSAVVNMKLPPGFAFVSASGSGVYSQTENMVSWNLPSVKSGSGALIRA